MSDEKRVSAYIMMNGAIIKKLRRDIGQFLCIMLVAVNKSGIKINKQG